MVRLALPLVVVLVTLTACGGSESSSSTKTAGGGSSASTTNAGNGGSSSGSFDDLSGLGPCLKSAGATLVTVPAQLAFALPAIRAGDVEVDVAGQLRDGSVTRSYKQSSGKNGGWVIYVGGPKGSEPPGLGDLTTKRLGAGQVAGFVRPADPAVVKKADDCLDGDVDS